MRHNAGINQRGNDVKEAQSGAWSRWIDWVDGICKGDILNELSLFSGAGGGLLGTKLLGWKALGYVEFNDYCQRVLKARIEDGILDEAPIFGDIKTFISEGYAEAYQGLVDVVTAGFPCQPFSVAGKRAGEYDPRNMWPETIECLRIIRPRYAYLENVPGILAHEYGRTIFRELAESGYDARWRVLSASEVGAPHKRDRLWILAESFSCADSTHRGPERKENGIQKEHRAKGCARVFVGTSLNSENVAYADKERLQGIGQKREAEGSAGLCNGARCDKISSIPATKSKQAGRIFERQFSANTGTSGNGARQADWWSVEPKLGRVANGVADRTHRLKAIGNGQVPRVVAEAWTLLNSL